MAALGQDAMQAAAAQDGAIPTKWQQLVQDFRSLGKIQNYLFITSAVCHKTFKKKIPNEVGSTSFWILCGSFLMLHKKYNVDRLLLHLDVRFFFCF